MTEIKGYGESAEANTSAAPAAAGTAAPSATDLLPVAEEAYRLLKSGSDYCSAQAAEALLVVLPAVIELRLGGVEAENALAVALVAQPFQTAVAHGHDQIAFG